MRLEVVPFGPGTSFLLSLLHVMCSATFFAIGTVFFLEICSNLLNRAGILGK